MNMNKSRELLNDLKGCVSEKEILEMIRKHYENFPKKHKFPYHWGSFEDYLAKDVDNWKYVFDKILRKKTK